MIEHSILLTDDDGFQLKMIDPSIKINASFEDV